MISPLGPIKVSCQVSAVDCQLVSDLGTHDNDENVKFCVGEVEVLNMQDIFLDQMQ